MKTVALGDTQGRSFWKLILAKEKPNRVIFIGDYFDSYDFSLIEQLHNFKEIMDIEKQYPEIEVIRLIGNHDHHYFPEIGYSGTSGFQGAAAFTQIGALLNEHRSKLQMAYSMDDIIFSHAGIGEGWMERIVNNKIIDKLPEHTAEDIAEWVNIIWEHKPLLFTFTGREGSGDDMGQTPIWIRPRSLMKDGINFKKKLIQVVGHTQQHQIDIEGKATGGRYYFMDTLGTSGEYLIIEDDKFSVNKI